MEKREEYGVKLFDPSLTSALDSNAHSILGSLFAPRRTVGGPANALGKVRVTRPGYNEAAQVPYHAGTRCPNGALAPLAGGSYRYPVQRRGPSFLEPL